MHSPASLTLLPLLLLLPLTQALPTTTTPLNPVSDLDLSKRQTATTCGNTLYPQQSLQAALNAGCSYTNQGGQAGGSSYPHVYNNYEGFDFAAGGTYYEFPIVMGGAYDGGEFWTLFFFLFFASLGLDEIGGI